MEAARLLTVATDSLSRNSSDKPPAIEPLPQLTGPGTCEDCMANPIRKRFCETAAEIQARKSARLGAIDFGGVNGKSRLTSSPSPIPCQTAFSIYSAGLSSIRQGSPNAGWEDVFRTRELPLPSHSVTRLESMINQDPVSQVPRLSPTRLESTVSDEEKREVEQFLGFVEALRRETLREGTKKGKSEGGENQRQSALNGTEAKPGLSVDQELN